MDRLISDGTYVDMILVDPPYGSTSCKWDNIIPFESMWQRISQVIKPNGAIVIFGCEPFSSLLRLSNIKEYRYDWVWIKDKGSDPLNANKRPLNNIENICVFYKKACCYNPQMTVASAYTKKQKTASLGKHLNDKEVKASDKINSGYRYPLRNLYFARDTAKGKSYHPTQKPVALLEYLIKTYTNNNEIILDFTMGSGSTGVAALKTNRRFIGIEMDTNYFNIAQNRIGEIEQSKIRKGGN